MMDQRTVEATGAPLAVCINDCRLDCGQGASELAPVCFQVGCAFAEMRWGSRLPVVARQQDEQAELR
ncbi:MAG: hypothetical protein WAU45_14425 [Blastocatellia bacterium]